MTTIVGDWIQDPDYVEDVQFVHADVDNTGRGRTITQPGKSAADPVDSSPFHVVQTLLTAGGKAGTSYASVGYVDNAILFTGPHVYTCNVVTGYYIAAARWVYSYNEPLHPPDPSLGTMVGIEWEGIRSVAVGATIDGGIITDRCEWQASGVGVGRTDWDGSPVWTETLRVHTRLVDPFNTFADGVIYSGGSPSGTVSGMDHFAEKDTAYTEFTWTRDEISTNNGEEWPVPLIDVYDALIDRGFDDGYIIFDFSNTIVSPGLPVPAFFTSTAGSAFIGGWFKAASERPYAHYTLRPPRYRYIYEPPVVETVPKLRLYPRDDVLGFGGVARQYPPPRRGRKYGQQP